MQESPSNKGTMITTGIVALVVGLLVGFGITKAMDSNDDTDKSSSSTMQMTSSSKANDLRASLVSLGTEHMVMTDQAVGDALDGSPGAADSAKALDTNGMDIAAAVGSIYGKDAEATVNKVWKLHLDDFVKYAVAGSKGDAEGKTAALADIDANYTKPLAQYLAKANPNLPEGTLESGLREHVDMTAKVIDMHNAKDYAGEATELKMADMHIKGLFNTLADGIIKQYPDKFKS